MTCKVSISQVMIKEMKHAMSSAGSTSFLEDLEETTKNSPIINRVSSYMIKQQ